MRRCSSTRRLRQLALGLGLLSAIAFPPGLSAQNVLDRGSYRLTLAGQDVGSESFSIRQEGSGAAAVTVAQATVTLDSGKVAQELTAWLRLSPAGARAAEYRLNVQGSGQQQITGTAAGGRFSARIVSPAGEMMREYLAGDGAIVVDDGLVHQYYFLGQRAGSGPVRVPLLIPRQSRQAVATVTPAGSDPVDIGGRRVEARRLRIAIPGLPEREIWLDAQGRVLRLAVPATGFVATRTAL